MNGAASRSERPIYAAVQRCPACGERSPQRMFKAHLVRTLPVPGQPFLRAFGWTDGTDRTEESPLHHGICLCAECRYPGTEADFREGGNLQGTAQTLRRLFVEQSAGVSAPLVRILGSFPESDPQPERAVRYTLGAIAAQRMVYPEYWRVRLLGRLYLRLTWLYLDELHLSWTPGHRGALLGWEEHGPGRDRLERVLDRLEPLRALWPDLPLDEESARRAALWFHLKAWQLQAEEQDPIDVVSDERELAELYALNGDLNRAGELFCRALDSCLRLRNEAYQAQQTAWDRGLTLGEARALTVRVQRLTKMAEDLHEAARTYGPGDPRRLPEVRPLSLTASAASAEEGEDHGRRNGTIG